MMYGKGQSFLDIRHVFTYHILCKGLILDTPGVTFDVGTNNQDESAV